MEKVIFFFKYIFTGQLTNNSFIYLPTTTFIKKWWVFILDAAWLNEQSKKGGKKLLTKVDIATSPTVTDRI